jgi:hypothetical protein
MPLIKKFDADFSFMNLFPNVKTIFSAERIFSTTNDCDYLVAACPKMTEISIHINNFLLSICTPDKISTQMQQLTLIGDSSTGLPVLPYFMDNFLL